MNEISLIFPHQLFRNSPAILKGRPVYLIEEYLFFKQYAFHKQKIAFHRATMKNYENFLVHQGFEVHYIDAQQERSDIRHFLQSLERAKVDEIYFIDPVDDWLNRRLEVSLKKSGIKGIKLQTPCFLNKEEDIEAFFSRDKKKFFQTEFYIQQRKIRNILLDEEGKPQGGKWSFDQDNRKKYPQDKRPPAIDLPKANVFFREAVEYVREHFDSHPGELGVEPYYPVNFEQATAWLNQFLDRRLEEFGSYEDAIVAEESVLNHSVLTPMLNIGLLTPKQILEALAERIKKGNIPINSSEGFIRQVMGWREFIRGVYCFRGRDQRTANFWNFKRKIPASFYEGTTGIAPLDNTISKVLKYGYCHHIERLMILGNFMVLCEFDPDEVHRWFMEMFVDAYDWVMVPNVYGMSQFADGGLMATKPYISGSNYVMKMSDYQKGDWQLIWDALFWRFMHVHRDFFQQNPRMGMLVKTFDKMRVEKKERLLSTAASYLDDL